MVSWRQEQNLIMNFAVPLLKMLTLYMLWRAQFLSNFCTRSQKVQYLLNGNCQAQLKLQFQLELSIALI